MILVIDLDPSEVIFKSDSRIVVRLHYYSEFAQGAYLWTGEGYKYEGPDKVKLKKKANLNVGQNGGLSLGKGV